MIDSSNDPPVTVSVLRRVKPGYEIAFEQAIVGICDVAMQFPGHLGVNVFRPANPSEEYRIVFKFDRMSNLRRWEESDERRQWMEKLESLTSGKPEYQILTGLETWFTLPAKKTMTPPPRYKMAVLTWLAIFPLLVIVNFLFIPIFTYLPHPILRTFVISIILVFLMTYVVMPRMTRLFAKWLYSKS